MLASKPGQINNNEKNIFYARKKNIELREQINKDDFKANREIHKKLSYHMNNQRYHSNNFLF